MHNKRKKSSILRKLNNLRIRIVDIVKQRISTQITVTKVLLILLALVSIAFSSLLTIFFYATQVKLNLMEQKIIIEISKSLMQLIVVVVIGGGLTALFKAFEDRRKEEKEAEAKALEELKEEEKEEKEAEQRYQEKLKLASEIRVDYLQRVGRAYRIAKSTRRALRAAGITTKFKNPPTKLNEKQLQIYKAQMVTLDSSQLELEGLKIEARSLPALLNVKDLEHNLASMENYLRKILREYERSIAEISEEKGTVDFSSLEKLSEFTGSLDKSNRDGFEQKLATPHDNVIKLVSNNTFNWINEGIQSSVSA